MKNLLISAAAALVLVGCGTSKNADSFRLYNTIDLPAMESSLSIAKFVPIKFNTKIKKEGWENYNSMDSSANVLCTEHEFLKAKLGSMEQDVRIDYIINISVSEHFTETTNGSGVPVRESDCSYVGLAVEYKIAEKPDMCCQR